jgi:hypothetical protein
VICQNLLTQLALQELILDPHTFFKTDCELEEVVVVEDIEVDFQNKDSQKESINEITSFWQIEGGQWVLWLKKCLWRPSTTCYEPTP